MNSINYWDYSANGAVPFLARKLRGAEVVWINLKWAASEGVDITDIGALSKLKLRILRDYAFIVPREEDKEECFSEEYKTFFADRYGEAGMVAHGGSGRAGSWMDLQVKGIGVTPLVGKGAGWLHAHGCAWMEEAIREVVYSQLYEAEFPNGAVPVVAIIDTGLHADMPKGHIGERRALVLRPAVFRVSHLLRATFYQSRVDVRAEQHRDAVRTRDAVALFKKSITSGSSGIGLSLEELNRAAAESIAFGEIFRLSNGGVTASTLSLQGRFIDFGSARALPDWRAAEMVPGSSPFGSDAASWTSMLGSLSYLLNKYGVEANATLHRQLFARDYQLALVRSTLMFWGVRESELQQVEMEKLVNLTFDIFQIQQKEHVSYIRGSAVDPYGRDWIYDDIFRIFKGMAAIGRYAGRLMEISQMLMRATSSRPQGKFAEQAFLLPVLRHSYPRHVMFREGLQKGLFESVVPTNPLQKLREGAIDDVVTACLSHSRRFFKAHIYEHVESVYDDGYSTIVHTDGPGDGGIYIEAVRFGQHVKLGHLLLPLADISQFCIFENCSVWRGKIPRTALRNGRICLDIQGRCIDVALFSWMDP